MIRDKITRDFRGRRHLKFGVAAVAVLGLLTGCGTNSGNSTSVKIVKTSNTTTSGQAYLTYTPSKYVDKPDLTQKWLKTDSANKSVAVALTLHDKNLSINGYYHGFLAVEIPLGWHVTVNFKNDNQLITGNLVLVTPKAVLTGDPTPAIKGAVMPNLSQGIGTGKSTSFQFDASKTGDYVLESVPTALTGSWVWFIINSNLSTPKVEVRK